MRRRLALAAAAAALCIFPRPSPAEPEASPGQMDNFSLSGLGERGRKNWDIAGKSADIGAQVIKLNDVQGNLYGDNSTVHLTAQSGDFNRQLGQLHLEKDVVVTTSEGAKLTTDRLDWDRKQQLVSTQSQVDIVKEDMHITGQGASARPDLNAVDFHKDVRVNIGEQAPAQPGRSGERRKEQITIRCEGPLQVDYAANIAVFNNDVDVQTPDCRIKSDRMEVLFRRDPGKAPAGGELGGSKIERIIARGNVRIMRNDDVSYCEEATYTAGDRKVSLSGSPKLVIFSEDMNAPAGN
jgi:LPS export ABC transporter protein LptC